MTEINDPHTQCMRDDVFMWCLKVMNMQSSKIEKMIYLGDAGKSRDLAEVIYVLLVQSIVLYVLSMLSY